MTPTEALAHHLTQRPEMPRPFHPDSAIAIAWQRAFQQWTTKKESLEIDIRIGRTEPAYTSFTSLTKAPKASKPANRPAWSGADPEYMAQKKREQRARDKATPKPCVEDGCTQPRNGFSSRCVSCGKKAHDIQQQAKNNARTIRRAQIREGLNQRKDDA